MTFTLDTPLDDPSGPRFSARSINVCQRAGITTLRQIKNKGRETMLRLPGCGAGAWREMADAILFAERSEPGLFEDQEYQNFVRGDRLTTIQALLHAVQSSLLRVALAGRISSEQRRHVASKLRDAANYIEQLYVIGDE